MLQELLIDVRRDLQAGTARDVIPEILQFFLNSLLDEQVNIMPLQPLKWMEVFVSIPHDVL